MRTETNWCSTKNGKPNKLDAKYLKNTKTIYDEFNRVTEISEVNFLTIPSKFLLDVLDHVDELRLKHNYDDENASPCDYDYFDLTDKMETYQWALKKCFNMDTNCLFTLIKKYICFVNNTNKYDTFAKILNATCKLTYVDYDNCEYCYYDKTEQQASSKVDSNFAGSYNLLLDKPIPLKIIRALTNEVDIYQSTKNKKDTTKYDKEFSDKQLDELAEKL